MGRKRVAVAMSGGVDSSVAAALLKEAGYEVIGIMMKLHSREKESAPGGCSSLDTVQDARQVAEKLAIPFHVVNFHDLFEKQVITYFTAEYLRGRTPNPCIACNRHLKFSALLENAFALKADYLATGHYVKVAYSEARERYLLYRGEDKQKDQSYFLYNLTQRQLAHTLFPLGEYTKLRIREKAVQLGLKVADKPESQEICFIPDDDYKRFLVERLGTDAFKPGKFVNTKGEVLGEHQGLPFYTVGQRKGLGLALGDPVFVVALNPLENTVVVGREEEVFQQGLWAQDNNYIVLSKLEEPLKIQAKIRSGAVPAEAVLTPKAEGQVKVIFKEPQRAITPGQSIVYYQGDLVVGGGIIDEVIRK
ncbi:MAG TPA: tRNA 2-thiouridine(34) synthase MnmA [Clostridia bacterium]|jgi:tRNA-specific 2-thiouridylase|nr:tRNA 2-thiouridine(34) synthase MnmA [Clostridia bacterium]HHY06765.1 tRNA 2-thiouridine(34) synthase MnmA [Clostridia bacterium]